MMQPQDGKENVLSFAIKFSAFAYAKSYSVKLSNGSSVTPKER